MAPDLMSLPTEIRQQIITYAIWHDCDIDDSFFVSHSACRSCGGNLNKQLQAKELEDADMDDQSVEGDGDNEDEDEDDDDNGNDNEDYDDVEDSIDDGEELSSDDENDDNEKNESTRSLILTWTEILDELENEPMLGFRNHAHTYTETKRYIGDNLSTARNLRSLCNRTINNEVYYALKCFKTHLEIHKASLDAQNTRLRNIKDWICPHHGTATCPRRSDFETRKTAWCVDRNGLRQEGRDLDRIMEMARPHPIGFDQAHGDVYEISHVVSREYRCTRADPQGRLEYRLRKAGYPSSCDVWVPAQANADRPEVQRYEAENPCPDSFIPRKPRGRALVLHGKPVWNSAHVWKKECKHCGVVDPLEEPALIHDYRFFVQPPGIDIKPRWINEQQLRDWYPEEHRKCFHVASSDIKWLPNGRPERDFERIVGADIRARPGEFDKVPQLLVRWKGFGPKDDTWLKVSELQKACCHEMNDFHAGQHRKGRVSTPWLV